MGTIFKGKAVYLDFLTLENGTIIRERINLCLLKLRLLKQSIKIHRCVVNTVVVWLHILGPYWCLFVALFGSRHSLMMV